jgi:hypothetical protein
MREHVSDKHGFEFVDYSGNDSVFVSARIKNSEVVHNIGGSEDIFEFGETREVVLTNKFVPDQQRFFGIRVEFGESSDGRF